jgi:hypothetical protein
LMSLDWMVSGLVLVSGVALMGTGDRGGPLLAYRRDALDAGQRARQHELRQKLLPAVVARQEIADGYAFELGNDAATFLAAAEWVILERRCCPFLTFNLGWADRGGVVLRLTGPPGVREFLDTEAHR